MEDVDGTCGAENSSDGEGVEGTTGEVEAEFEGTASVVLTAGVELDSGSSSVVAIWVGPSLFALGIVAETNEMSLTDNSCPMISIADIIASVNFGGSGGGPPSLARTRRRYLDCSSFTRRFM